MSIEPIIDSLHSTSHLGPGSLFTILAGLGESHLEHVSEILDTVDHIDSGVVGLSDGKVSSVIGVSDEVSEGIVNLGLHALVHIGSVAISLDSSSWVKRGSLG